MELRDALASYLIQLEASGRVRNTRLQIQRHGRLLIRWLEAGGGSTEVGDITHETLAQFLVSPEARNRPDGRAKRATSTNALRSSLRVTFAYLHAAGYTTTNPARLIRRARCGTAPPRGLSAGEQHRLLVVLRAATGDTSERDRVLFELMLGTGGRVGEVLALDVEDVDLDRGEMLMRSTKGNWPRTTYIPERVAVLLRAYLAGRSSGPVFESRHRHRRLSIRQAARRLHLWLARAGVRHYSLHALRHSFGQGLYERTRDPFLVQAAMGHRSIASTLVYAGPTHAVIRTAIG